jgi:hypothetical protein
MSRFIYLVFTFTAFSLPSLQRLGNFVYSTLHMNKPNVNHAPHHDPTEPVEVPSGWVIAPNDDDAREVCGKYNWQVYELVLGDGKLVGSRWHSQRHNTGMAGKRRLC